MISLLSRNHLYTNRTAVFGGKNVNYAVFQIKLSAQVWQD